MFEKTEKQIEESYNAYIEKYPFLKDKIEENMPMGSEKILYKKCISQMLFEDMLSVDFADIKTHIEYVQKALQTFDYCKDIPEEIVLDFILPYRTNNESFALYTPKFFGELKDIAIGKTRSEAAKAVNFWCLSKATYAQADERTQNALATYNAGKGRCGEESVFTVAALRSVGIPARQVYCPVWSHCDDNHAWTEVYTENGWEYMGSCEPEDSLNDGWFNNASSRALAVRYRKFGYGEREQTFDINNIYQVGLTTDVYCKTHKVKIYVNPIREGIKIGIYVVNYGRPCLVLENNTDKNGIAEFTLGQGDFLAFAHQNEDYDFVQGGNKTESLTLDLTRRPSRVDFSLVPSKGEIKCGEPFKTEEYFTKIAKLNKERLDAHKPVGDRNKDLSGHNYSEIKKFLDADKYTQEEKDLVLSTLTEKDFCDVTFEILEDIAVNLKYLKNQGEKDSFWNEKLVLPLRIKSETLFPHREFAAKYLDEHNLTDAQSIYNHLLTFKRYDEYSLQRVTPDLKAVLKYGCLTSASLPIHFAQLCRVIGIPAGIAVNGGAIGYKTENGFLEVGEKESDLISKIRLQNNSDNLIRVDEDVALSRIVPLGIEDHYFDNLKINQGEHIDICAVKENSVFIETVSKREIDGSVYGYLEIKKTGRERIEFNIEAIPDRTTEKLLAVKMPELFGKLDGNQIVAFIDNSAEPTEHFLNEILENVDELCRYNVKIKLYTKRKERNEILNKTLALDFVEFNYAEFTHEWDVLRKSMEIGDFRLPFITAVKDGIGLYSFANYNVGTVKQINHIFDVMVK